MNKLTRRAFFKKSMFFGSAITASNIFQNVADNNIAMANKNTNADLSAIFGTDYFKITKDAVDKIGGMNKFVKKGQSVGLLINSAFSHPGSYTNPDIVFSVLKMCFDAGAKTVYCLRGESDNYFKRSSLFKKQKGLINKITKLSGNNIEVPVKGGSLLKNAEIVSELLKIDVLINIPILKDHSDTKFTCCLKNMMGAATFKTNKFFHFGSGKNTSSDDWYSNVDFLSQCIADLNLLRKPDLNIVDATNFIISNGPSGPGNLKKENKVVAGKDTVSVDAYCTQFLGLKPAKVSMIVKADKNKTGSMIINKLKIVEQKG